METIIFTITKKEDGLSALTYMCNAIKEREDANHKLFFSRRLMGMYGIFNAKDESADREVIFVPIGMLDQILNKNIVDTRNCMWFAGDSPTKQARLQGTIDWLLKKGGVLRSGDS